ncbi:ceramidase [Infundibulicybe gibba]|nr:ceramidase [Infundibulicybe gibba]
MEGTVNNSTQVGFYGPVTATLDWCEANYQFSYYVAEMANTFSNLFTVFLAVYGLVLVRRENLPTRCLVGNIGVGLVGVGSFAFHATLLFQAQLADELPMIYVGSMGLWLLFDTVPGFSLAHRRSQLITLAIAIFDVLFSWSYHPDYLPPKWSTFASRIPADKRATISQLFGTGAVLFASGFLIWNLDNIFCDTLTQWKVSIGWPAAFLLEGHSWWHVLTGAGAYFKFIGIQCTMLCVKDDHRKYTVGYEFGLPHVQHVGKKVQ